MFLLLFNRLSKLLKPRNPEESELSLSLYHILIQIIPPKEDHISKVVDKVTETVFNQEEQ